MHKGGSRVVEPVDLLLVPFHPWGRSSSAYEVVYGKGPIGRSVESGVADGPKLDL